MGARASRSNPETRVRALVQGLTATLTSASRTPIMRTPDELGLSHQEVTFASTDGVRLEGWFLPGRSDKLLVCVHPAHGNRYGLPGHLKDWLHLGGRELSLLPLYRALQEAGYGVLCFDLRNHGKSGGDHDANQRYGMFEYRDVLGALRYLRERRDTRALQVTLLGLGLGANASLIALAHEAAELGVRGLVAVQAGSTRPVLARVAARTGLAGRFELFEQAIQAETWHELDALSPLPYAPSVRVPTLSVQLRSDWEPQLRDALALHEALGSKRKKLCWLDTPTRIDGYAKLIDEPAPLLAWLEGQATRAARSPTLMAARRSA